ncbi:hypothetical protein Q1695_003389 [Nippostrongylus brasiliensis]|nr:hypothetical protein Q1695_003389 [Nippostrongylus brasiliensis]
MQSAAGVREFPFVTKCPLCSLSCSREARKFVVRRPKLPLIVFTYSAYSSHTTVQSRCCSLCNLQWQLLRKARRSFPISSRRTCMQMLLKKKLRCRMRLRSSINLLTISMRVPAKRCISVCRIGDVESTF